MVLTHPCRQEPPLWFARESWNAGEDAIQAKVLAAAAELYRASGSFRETFINPTQKNLRMQTVCMSLSPYNSVAGHKHYGCFMPDASAPKLQNVTTHQIM